MATILYILYMNGLYQKMPEATLVQERGFFENVGNGGIMKLMVFVDVCIWVVGFISLSYWYLYVGGTL